MNRRDLIKIAAVATSASVLVLASCQPAPKSTNTPLGRSTEVSTTAATDNPTHTLVTIPGTDSWNMVSKINGQEYRIFVELPSEQAVRSLPVIYMVDGNGNFPLIHTIHGILVGDSYLPPAILVGIDYPFDEFDEYKDLRTRDFTPTTLPGNSPMKSTFPGATGGAPAFLRFLQEELKPLIDSKYNILPDDSTLVGHSLGGLFALYALFQEPAPFQRYVIGSPSIWWDNNAILNQLDSFSSVQTDLPARVFMGVGANEDYMVSDMLKLADKLEGYQYPGLRLTTQVFEDETHLSMIPFFITRGLRAVNE